MDCRNATGRRSPKGLLHGYLVVFLMAISIAVLAPVQHHDFVAWDDDLHVYDNPRFHPTTWRHIVAFWRAPYEHLYMPLTYTAWGAIAWLTRMWTDGPLIAAPFHTANLVLHLASVLVVYRLGLLVLCKGDPSADRRLLCSAALGALVFGVHPLQIEAVAWVSGLKDVLWGWWSLIALWQYLEFVRSPGRSRRSAHYACGIIAFGLALLAKPAAVVVPAIAWLLDTVSQGRSWRCATRALGLWLGLAVLCSVSAKGQQPNDLLAQVPPLWSRLVVATDAVAFYVGKLVWPVALSPDYGRTPQVVLDQSWRATLGPVLVGFIGALLYKRRHWSGLWLGAAMFVVGLIPVLGIVPFAFQHYSTVADRYVYIALLGPALGLAWVMMHTGRQWPSWVFCTLMVGMLALRGANQVQVWRDTVTLFTHTLRVNPQSTLAHNNLGLALARQGDLDQATTHFQAALAFEPDLPEAHYNLGNALTLKGEINKAITHYSQALRLRPNWAEASYNLGHALAQQGRLQVAQIAYRHALRQRPSWPQPAIRLVNLLLTPANVPEAVAAEAVRLAETACSATAYQDADALLALARAYLAAGRLEAAGSAARRALALAGAAGRKTLMTEIISRFPDALRQEASHAVP